MKKEYEKKSNEFKARNTYLEFLEERQKVKTKENKSVNLFEMPKRPKSRRLYRQS